MEITKKLKKITLGNDPFSLSFIKFIEDLPHFKTMKQLEISPKIQIEETEYYKYFLKLFEKDGNVWNGILKTKDDIKKQTLNFLDMVSKVDLHTKADDKILYDEKCDHYYGQFPIKILKDGRFMLYDGHHRIAIRWFRKIPFTLTICNRDPEWKEFLNIVKGLYPNDVLYQKINHPEFSEYKVAVDKNIDKIIYNIVTQNKIKKVLDIGSCHGENIYMLRKLIDFGMSVEYNKERYEIIKKIYTHVDNIHSTFYNASSFLLYTDYTFDLICCNSVFHHILKQYNSDFTFLLQAINKKCKVFTYILPEENESQFQWIPKDMQKNIHKIIQDGIGFKHIYKFKLIHRYLYVMSKEELNVNGI